MFSEEPKAALLGIPDIMNIKMLFIFGGGGQRSRAAAMGGEGGAQRLVFVILSLKRRCAAKPH
jgi:hypothetical protein